MRLLGEAVLSGGFAIFCIRGGVCDMPSRIAATPW